MCLKDKAIGRRSIVRQTVITAPSATRTRIPADPRRLAISVGHNTTTTMTAFYADDQGGQPFFVASQQFNGPTPQLRVDDWGVLIMSDIYIGVLNSGDVTALVVEILADYTLDKAIQEEV